MESAFLEAVRTSFEPFLRSGKLRVTSSLYDKEAFGNAAVVLEGRHFALRLVRDRSQEFAEVRATLPFVKWRPCGFYLHAAGVPGVSPEPLLRSVDDVAGLVGEHLNALELACGPLRYYLSTRRTIKRLDAEAWKRFQERCDI